MKLILIALLTVLSYHCCIGYPVLEGEHSKDPNGTLWLDMFNGTVFNNSSPQDMLEFKKNLLNQVKTVLKMVRAKINEDFDKADDLLSENGTSIEDWLNSSNETASNDTLPLDMNGIGKKVVNKVKGGIRSVKDRVKDKINNFKKKIGSKDSDVGGSAGGYLRDKYNRDHLRDEYDSNHYRRDDVDIVSYGSPDPNAKWVSLGIGICFICGISIVLIYYKVKGNI